MPADPTTPTSPHHTADDVYQRAATVLIETVCDFRPGAMTYLTLLSEGDALGKAVRAAVDAAQAPLAAEVERLQARVAAVREQAQRWVLAADSTPGLVRTDCGAAILRLLDAGKDGSDG